MADLDGDGKSDLITGCFEGGSYVLRGKGGGAFEAPKPVLDKKGDAEVSSRMREMVSKRTPERRHVDLNEVVIAVTKMVASDSIIRQVFIDLDLAPDELIVEADRVQLEQVVLNLLLNALDAASMSNRVPHKVVIVTNMSDRSSSSRMRA